MIRTHEDFLATGVTVPRQETFEQLQRDFPFSITIDGYQETHELANKICQERFGPSSWTSYWLGSTGKNFGFQLFCFTDASNLNHFAAEVSAWE